METTTQSKVDADRKVWFSMWFLAAIVTFGLALFPMFYRLLEGRNRHFKREAELEKQVADYLKNQGKELPALTTCLPGRNAKAWAVSINFTLRSGFHIGKLSIQLLTRLEHPNFISSSIGI